MTPIPHERRRTPRVLPPDAYAVTLRPLADTRAPTRYGRLVDASLGGLAFLSEDTFATTEQLHAQIHTLAGATVLRDAHARVVAVERSGDDELVHCAFSADPPPSWLEALALPATPSVSRADRHRILSELVAQRMHTSAGIAAATGLPLAAVEMTLGDFEQRKMVARAPESSSVWQLP